MDARLRLCRSWRGRAHLSILRETPLQIVSEGDKAPEAIRRFSFGLQLLRCAQFQIASLLSGRHNRGNLKNVYFPIAG